MRPEKKYMVEEVSRHLDKSDYVYLTNYDRVTVEEVAELRGNLANEGAEFHVVKNTILNVAAQEKGLPDMRSHLSGPVAIVVGGNNPSGVAKVLKKFFKDKEKVEMKAGILSGEELDASAISALAELPSMEVLRAKLLSLLSTPAQQTVTIFAAVPTGLLNVLQAKSEQESA
ncbi:MAG: 50S ribosomal protein L10 [Opitutales bacterium]|nr:50S ribosomal protein L10 [Opitutales bacterium]MCH8540134.1 50S ribosomal protein L10 [Opitutales bacterium]